MRKVLEDLIFVGDVKETYKVVGHDWTLKTLTSEEQMAATDSTRNYDNVARINALKTAVLARSIIELDGIAMKDIRENIEFLGTISQSIIDLVYDKYLELQRKQDEELKNVDEDLKN